MRGTAHEAAGTSEDDALEVDATLRAVLVDVLALDPAVVATFTSETGLFGELPELDSMAVAGLLTEMEDRLDILIEDDEVDGDMMETYGALRSFILAKRAGA
jgi:acyl carrier protein